MTRVWTMLVVVGCAASDDGAAGAAGGTVLAVSLSSAEGARCTGIVEENIVGAHVSEPTTDSAWFNTSIYPRTDNGAALLGAADDGSVVFTFGGDLYVGTRDGDTITATTQSGYTDIVSAGVEAADYERVYTSGYDQDSTLTLALEADGYTWTGTVDDHWVNHFGWEETDLYDLTAYTSAAGGPGSPYNTLTNAVLTYLVIDDFVANVATGVECDDEMCWLTVAEDCTETQTITAVETNLDPGVLNID